MFEKSLVDLIRGLRGNKGQESEYIQRALTECRNEIRSQDMDVKATALLKLVYLEMFGHDMTWAAFNVLEVMASSKQMQKRVGYLAAVQTFRPETEVLMLAENLLKKDLTSPSIPTLSLPLVTIPHIVTPSLALSILTELLPRLSHSQPSVRKKTIVSLYRLALVYPETLRVAWPKIKDRLLDEQESSSVTHACVNVVCELGWRRPQDFLALAPRLFDLLTSDKNNWMSIKIIKLFAVLTPIEPRLVKKLVRPLTKILRETSAMSLLYECISGIIQGGILDGSEGGLDVDEVADLCISKLRGMIVLEGDPNLKYVALLAFNRIVTSHPKLVSQQQDVIMTCLDDPDISIKMQALELVSGMVDSDNLQAVVNRLMKQLANAPSPAANGVALLAEEADNTDLEQRLVPDKRGSELAPLPDEYRHEIISRILDICSVNTYANITDFEWYIEILVHLVRHLPSDLSNTGQQRSYQTSERADLGTRIGTQLVDIAVRVKELRPDATQAAEKFVLVSNRSIIFASHAGGQSPILKSAAWICGEFAASLSSPYEVLNSVVHDSSHSLPAPTLSTYIQAIPKVLSQVVVISNREWNISRSTTLALVLARTLAFLETLSLHPNLEVQERSVEILELLKVASESLSSQPPDSLAAPILLTTIIPSLFTNQDLNPVAPGAQSKVPLPSTFDLDTAINSNLQSILLDADALSSDTEDIYTQFYHERIPSPTTSTVLQPSTRPTQQYSPSRSISPTQSYQSYQTQAPSPTTLARRKADRQARARDDPFYIPSGRSTPIHSILRDSNGGPDDLDIDSIPIMELDLNEMQQGAHNHGTQGATSDMDMPKRKKKPSRKFAIAADETIDDATSQSQSNPTSLSTTPRPPISSTASAHPHLTPSPAYAHPQPTRPFPSNPARSLLTIPSSSHLSLSNFSLNDSTSVTTPSDLLQPQQEYADADADEDAEMAAALALVERKRAEMQRDEERKRVRYAGNITSAGDHPPGGGGGGGGGGGEIGNGDGEVVKRKKGRRKRRDGKDGSRGEAVRGGGPGETYADKVGEAGEAERGEGVGRGKGFEGIERGQGFEGSRGVEGGEALEGIEGEVVKKNKKKKKKIVRSQADESERGDGDEQGATDVVVKKKKNAKRKVGAASASTTRAEGESENEADGGEVLDT